MLEFWASGKKIPIERRPKLWDIDYEFGYEAHLLSKTTTVVWLVMDPEEAMPKALQKAVTAAKIPVVVVTINK